MITTTSEKLAVPDKNIKNNQSIKTKINHDKTANAEPKNNPSGSDQVSLSYSAETTATYNSSLSLENKMSDGYDLLRGLVLNMFKDQGLEYTIDTDNGAVDISTLTPEKAQELLGDEGYFGVEKTSERIVQFAIGIAGGDPSRIEAIRQGVNDGFQQALDAMGGWLPDISHATYATVMQKLDDWAEPNKNNTKTSIESPTQVKS